MRRWNDKTTIIIPKEIDEEDLDFPFPAIHIDRWPDGVFNLRQVFQKGDERYLELSRAQAEQLVFILNMWLISTED